MTAPARLHSDVCFCLRVLRSSPWPAYMRRERAQYAWAAQYSSHASSGMRSQSPYSCRSGATLGGAMVYFDVAMPRQIKGGDSAPHRNAGICGNLRDYFLRVAFMSSRARPTVSSLIWFSLNSDSLLMRLVNAAMLTPFGRMPSGE
jgi:hypothetical protein